MSSSFTLHESYELGGAFTWRLKESEIRFRGSGIYANLVDRRIPAEFDQIVNFVDALNLIDVWTWREDYHPHDVGFEVMDGSTWSFVAAIEGNECKCGGFNAYPSFGAATQTTLDRGRYALLVAALYACFDIDTYIHIAKHQRQHDLEQTDNQGMHTESPS